MASDSQVVLDVDAPRVMIVREKAKSASGIWRTCGVLLAVALCAAAAVCFTLNKTQSSPDETQEAEIKHTLRQISETAKAAIHLSGHYNSQVSNTSVEWLDNADQSFASGLKLEGNEIKILRNGLYFVYSQASYHLSCTADNESEGQVMHMSHTMSRWSDSYGSWKPLLSSTRSACKKTLEEQQTHWYGAIYLGAAFNLEAGDRLRTDMDKKLLPKVETAGGKTFFGAFSL
ncbi:tumor necrosis factor a (TNF superfamily, member 2) [Pangasianodon hypophthalmus]|uniref:tumor necrosis factor a (TNF superfamily, member 2) n=1 Tax=Pangasianodon hypophthalmus TaxID=310915 RepID=UPI000EFED770|nr:tumor necrosis factor a (TNF superfamily, member 2) [Pangasianodon hypophthalmus]